MPVSFFMRAVSSGTYAFRSAVLSACRVYWYCAFDWRPPMRRSCAAWRNVCASRMVASCGRSRFTISVELAPRSSSGFKATNRKPPLVAPEPPVKPTAFFTPGSARTMVMARCSAPFILTKDASCGPCRPPKITPLSCWGKKPLGTRRR